jgi:hypothetical protein
MSNADEKLMVTRVNADEKLIEAHLTRRDGELMIADGYKLLARTSDLDCDPEIRCRRLRDGYLKLSDGHVWLAKAEEMLAEAGQMHLKETNEPRD